MAYEGAEQTDRAESNAELNATRLRGREPVEYLAPPPIDRLGEKLALVSSFGAESAVLLHMAAQIKPDIPVLFLDTGMLFGQTLDYRQQRLVAQLGLSRRGRDLRPQYQDLATQGPVGQPLADRHRGVLPHPQGACRSIRAMAAASTAGSPAASASRAAIACGCRWSRRARAS